MSENTPLLTGEIYHIYSKSIYGYKIFNRPEDYHRMLLLIQYYQLELPEALSHFLKSPRVQKLGFKASLDEVSRKKQKRIQLIMYCIMPTHIHFILRQTMDNGISRFMNQSFAGYSLYFNCLHNRHGPLWQSRFGRRHIEDLGDLISTSHYVHANPIKDLGKVAPEDWNYSSYREYCGTVLQDDCLCQWQDAIPIDSKAYCESMTDYLSRRVGLVA